MKKLAVFTFCLLFTINGICQQIPVPVETVIQLETVVTDAPPSISFFWNETKSDSGVNVYRKSANSALWQKIETIPPHINEFTDINIESTHKYEYRLESSYAGYVRPTTYINAGIKCKETEYRGKIILLVDSVFSEPLKYEISRLETDLIGDGWEIIRKDISRNSTVRQVKNFIRKTYYNDFENVNTVFLIGHIPVPYSGELAFDGHNGIGNKNHEGAWPADVYYADMNESFWTDSKVNNTLSINPDNHNVPGDGKFDRSTLENHSVPLAIGRVDFSNLPIFSQTEIELMRNYLNKDHGFRHKLINPKMQALVDENIDPLPVRWLDGSIVTYEMMALSGWRNFTALLNFENVKAGKFFPELLTDSYIWSYGSGYGTFTSCIGLGSSSDFVTSAPKTVFTGFYGSWFGDWNTENNFLRSALASDGWILTSCWSGRPLYVFHQMGMGETVGSCIQRSQNNFDTYYAGASNFSGAINMSLMGDPTLRMHIVSPVKTLQSQIINNASIELTWQAPEDDIIGYYIYKLDENTNKYIRLNSQIQTSTKYVDSSPETGNNNYMVRALQLTESASGSYYNLSQGVFDTIKVIPTHNSTVNLNSKIEFNIYPNPASEKITIETGLTENFKISITNVNGELLFNEYKDNKNCDINLSTFPSGVYFITINSNNKLTTKKFLKY